MSYSGSITPFYSEFLPYKSYLKRDWIHREYLGQLLEFAAHNPTKPPRLDVLLFVVQILVLKLYEIDPWCLTLEWRWPKRELTEIPSCWTKVFYDKKLQLLLRCFCASVRPYCHYHALNIFCIAVVVYLMNAMTLWRNDCLTPIRVVQTFHVILDQFIAIKITAHYTSPFVLYYFNHCFIKSVKYFN